MNSLDNKALFFGMVNAFNIVRKHQINNAWVINGGL